MSSKYLEQYRKFLSTTSIEIDGEPVDVKAHAAANGWYPIHRDGQARGEKMARRENFFFGVWVGVVATLFLVGIAVVIDALI